MADDTGSLVGSVIGLGIGLWALDRITHGTSNHASHSLCWKCNRRAPKKKTSNGYVCVNCGARQ